MVLSRANQTHFVLFLFTVPVMASPQIGRVESREYYSWMRGHHTYKDIFEPVISTTLTLQREPENAKDPHAVAIVEDTGRIVGHIPLALSRIVSSFLKRANHKATAEIQLFIRFMAKGNIWTDWTNLFMAARLQRGP